MIYLILNRVNGKVYVGQCVGGSEKRWGEHKGAARRGSNYHLYRAIRKYGVDAFSVYSLSTYATSPEDLDTQEQYYIAKYRATESRFGYNLSLGGANPMRGRKHSKETKQRQSISAKAWRIGRVLTRVPMTAVTKQRISQATKGRLPSIPKGTKLPESTRIKIQEAKQHTSDETRERLRTAALNRKKAPTQKLTQHVGKQYAYVTVIGTEHDDRLRQWMLTIKCECGRVSRERASCLVNGKRKTCGSNECPHRLVIQQESGRKRHLKG